MATVAVHHTRIQFGRRERLGQTTHRRRRRGLLGVVVVAMVLMLMQWVMMWLVIEHRWGQFIETWLFPWRRRRGVTWAICPIQLRELSLEQRRLKLHRSELFPRSHGRTVSTPGRPHGRHGLALVLDTATAAGLPHVTPHIIMICIIVTTTVWRPFAYKTSRMDGWTHR